jgi:hypothetical protein
MSQPTSPTSSPARHRDSLPGADVESPASQTSADYRETLASRRWDAAPLRNPEVEKTDPRIAVAAVLILATLTLIVLVLGYASGFWSLPADRAASAAVTALELLA